LTGIYMEPMMQKSSLKQNRVSFSALVIVVALAANGCASGNDPEAISQVGDELKGGIPGSGKTKDHGHGSAQAGAAGSENKGQGKGHSQAGDGSAAEHGQGKGHSQAGDGSAAEHGQGKAHSQAGDGAVDEDSGMDESK
jgi:hypothetical protein